MVLDSLYTLLPVLFFVLVKHDSYTNVSVTTVWLAYQTPASHDSTVSLTTVNLL
jgi:hypothetical protein